MVIDLENLISISVNLVAIFFLASFLSLVNNRSVFASSLLHSAILGQSHKIRKKDNIDEVLDDWGGGR